jgi:hypothetical protein
VHARIRKQKSTKQEHQMSNQGPSKSFITSLGMGLDRSSSIDLRPVVAGTADAGNILNVYDGVRCIGSTLVASDGTWAFKPTADLKTGKHQFTTIAVDHDGNYGLSSEPFFVSVPVGVPVETAKTPSSVYFMEADDMPASITGAATPGDLVRLYEEGALVATTTAGPGGWQFDLSAYPPGSHHFTVEAADAAGNRSVPLAVDATLRLKAHVLITDVVAQHVDVSGEAHHVSVGANGVTSDAAPTVHGDVYGELGRGEVVVVYRGSVRLGIATIDADHPANRVTWSFQDHDVPEGQQMYRARVEDAKGMSGFFGWSYWIREQAPDIASPTTVDAHGGDAAVGVLAPGESMHSSVAIGLLSGAGGGVSSSNVFWHGDDWAQRPINNDSGLNLVTPASDWNVHSVAIGVGSAEPGLVDVGLGHPFIGGDSVTARGNIGQDFLRSAEVPLDVNVAAGHAATSIGTGSASAVQVDSAGGIDTIRMVGDHQVLDLAMRSGKTSASNVHGVEAFDLNGQHNTLKLSLTDVLNLGERDLFVEDGRQQVKVSGGAGDTVDLSNSHIAAVADGDWQQHGSVALEGVKYDVYLHAGAQAELLVQQGVQAVIH